MFKPMLAKDVDLSLLDFEKHEYVASEKLDGIRAIVINGVVLSRTLKPIPNLHVQELFGRPEFENWDGELLVGPMNAPDVYHETYSGVMKKEGTPAVTFVAFDHFGNPNLPYAERRKLLRTSNLNVQILDQVAVRDLDHLQELEEKYLEYGFEGLMLRRVDQVYKFGRSTAAQQHLLKVKRYLDDEAVIVGFEELMSNQNEATTNALGRTERSSHAENKVPMGTLGALIVKNDAFGEFNVGTGFTAAKRQEIWDSREEWKGQLITFKYFPIGVKDKPRHPVYKGLRDPMDT